MKYRFQSPMFNRLDKSKIELFKNQQYKISKTHQ